MTRTTCVKCKKGRTNCKCSTTCRQCLTLGTLGSDGTCNCCKNCGEAQVTCEADGICQFEASGPVPQKPCSTAPLPQSQSSSNTTQAQHPTMFQQQKPPDLAMVYRDPSTLSFYCNLLRKWSKIGGYDPKNQGDIFTINAALTCPDLAMEMENKIGDEISDDPAAVDKIIKWLEERYGVDRQVDICKIFKKFFFSKRTNEMDLVTYVNKFELNYSELKKLGDVNISEVYLALFLFTNAQLNEVEFSILYSKLDFEKAMIEKDKTILDKTKAELRRSQYGKQISGASSSKTSVGDSTKFKTLVSEITGEEEIDEETGKEIKELVQTYIAGKKDKGIPRDAKGKIFKCQYCICKCPRNVRCGCECTKHPYWKCKNKPVKSDKRKEDENDKDKEANAT